MAPSTPNGDITTDERTPLLVAPPQPIDDDDIANGSSETIANADPVEKDEPLGVQILLLCVVRLVEPIAFFSIFPFINKMIFETGGVDKEDVGYYSGLIVSQGPRLSTVETKYGITNPRCRRACFLPLRCALWLLGDA